MARYRRVMRLTRLLLAFALTSGWMMATAGPASAGTTGACSATFNGIDAERIDSLFSPLELQVTDTLVFAGVDPGGTGEASVDVVIGPVVVETGSTAYAPPTESFSASIDLDDVSPYGVGLVRIRGMTDGCVVEAWLRITGRFPLATLTGITAAGLAIGGLTGQLGAIASRRRWSRSAAALGGLATGTGAAVLGQQFGWLQLSYISVAIIVLIASGLGFLLAGLLSSARRESRSTLAVDRVERPDQVDRGDRESTEAFRDEAGPRRTREMPSAAPYWCYVLAETDVLDLRDHSRVVGHLQPGNWYLAKREVGPWLHVSTSGGTEGWVARSAVHRHG